MAPDVRSLERIVERTAGDHPFSGVVRIDVGEDVLLDRAWGHRNRAERLPCEPDTRFATASGSNTFTAVAVCRIVDRGLVSLDQSVRDCISDDLPGIDRAVTIRGLLTHTSGIADYFDEEETDDFEALWRERPAYTVRTPGDVFEMFRGKGMKLAPDERFSYCNGGYVLLGLVVEEKAGTYFSRYVEESVFGPAGMTDSGYFAMDDLPERTALGYASGSDPGVGFNRRTRIGLLLVCALVMLNGCGPRAPEVIEGTSLRTTYYGLGCDCGTVALTLAPDRSFVLGCRPPTEDDWGVPHDPRELSDEEELLGTWESRGGDLTLKWESHTLVFRECEVNVSARGETALLPGLCWVSSSIATFADSARLVARDELEEFLHPTEGSGTRSSAL